MWHPELVKPQHWRNNVAKNCLYSLWLFYLDTEALTFFVFFSCRWRSLTLSRCRCREAKLLSRARPALVVFTKCHLQESTAEWSRIGLAVYFILLEYGAVSENFLNCYDVIVSLLANWGVAGNFSRFPSSLNNIHALTCSDV